MRRFQSSDLTSDEVESSGSDDDDNFVQDALGFSDPIADKSGDEGDEGVAEVVKEDESSEYIESSSEEEVEVGCIDCS